jgi:hypothetical protein
VDALAKSKLPLSLGDSVERDGAVSFYGSCSELGRRPIRSLFLKTAQVLPLSRLTDRRVNFQRDLGKTTGRGY